MPDTVGRLQSKSAAEAIADDAALLRQGAQGPDPEGEPAGSDEDSDENLEDSEDDEEPKAPAAPPPVLCKLYAIPRDYKRVVEVNIEMHHFEMEPAEDPERAEGAMDCVQKLTVPNKVKCVAVGPDYGEPKADTPATNKFLQAVKAFKDTGAWPNTYFCIPYDGRKVLSINIMTNAIEEVGKTFRKDGGKYTEAVCSTNRDGRMYAAPCRAQRLLEIDSVAGTVKEVGSVLGSKSLNKWWAISVSCGGRIYAIPYDAPKVLEIDPQRGGKCKMVGPDLGPVKGKYCCVAEAPNGNLYCAPLNANRVLEIDTIGRVRLVGPDFGPAERKYSSIVQAPNKLLYAPPLYAERVLEINCARGDTREIGDILGVGEAKYCCCAVGQNGKVYCPPLEARKVLEIDCEYHEVHQIGLDLGGGEVEKYSSICQAPAGLDKLYCAPRSAHCFLEICPRRGYVREVGHDFGRCPRKFNCIVAGAQWQGGLELSEYAKVQEEKEAAYRKKMEKYEKRRSTQRASIAASDLAAFLGGGSRRTSVGGSDRRPSQSTVGGESRLGSKVERRGSKIQPP